MLPCRGTLSTRFRCRIVLSLWKISPPNVPSTQAKIRCVWHTMRVNKHISGKKQTPRMSFSRLVCLLFHVSRNIDPEYKAIWRKAVCFFVNGLKGSTISFNTRVTNCLIKFVKRYSRTAHYSSNGLQSSADIVLKICKALPNKYSSNDL